MATHTTNYRGTFIEVAEGCPTDHAEEPPTAEPPSIAVLHHRLIAEEPYRRTSDDVIFETHALRRGIAIDDEAARDEFFSEGQPCLRSSPLGKRYGWGIHRLVQVLSERRALSAVPLCGASLLAEVGFAVRATLGVRIDTMRFVTRTTSAVILIMLMAVASGCASQSDEPPSVAERVVTGVPETWVGPSPDLINGNPAVGWLSADEFGVMTVGSSSCPPVASSFDVTGNADVRIEFAESTQETCTADMGATTHIFRLPEDVDGRPVVVTISFGSMQTDQLLLP